MKYIKQDITTVDAPAVIIHGVNCQRTMGSGVAKTLLTKWPQVRNQYIAYGTMILGDIQPIQVGEKLWVVNCFTQHKFGTDGDRYANEQSLEESLIKATIFTRSLDIYDIYSPRIGCGLGGLDWDKDVLPIFNKVIDMQPNISFTICDIN